MDPPPTSFLPCVQRNLLLLSSHTIKLTLRRSMEALLRIQVLIPLSRQLQRAPSKISIHFLRSAFQSTRPPPRPQDRVKRRTHMFKSLTRRSRDWIGGERAGCQIEHKTKKVLLLRTMSWMTCMIVKLLSL